MAITNTLRAKGRPQRTVRLLCTDFGGTLLDSRGGIGRRTMGALAEAARAGLTVVGVTGRPVRDALDITRRHGLTGPVVCSNGAVTVDGRTGDIQDCHGFAPGRATEILNALRTMVPGLALGVDSVAGLRLEPEFTRIVPVPWAHVVMPTGGSPLDGDPVVKILAAHPGQPVDELADTLAELIGSAAQITRSTGHFLELSAPGVDKGEALRRLARRLGIPLDHTAAVGDMPNDVPMLHAAGLAAAVAGAHEDALRAAAIVLPGNDDEGVATLIRMLLPRNATGEPCCI